MATEATETNTGTQTTSTTSNPDQSIDAFLEEARAAAEAEVTEQTGEESAGTEESGASQTLQDSGQDAADETEAQDEGDDKATFSRKDAKRYFDQLLKEKEKSASLEKEVADKNASEASLAQEVMAVLGTKEAYEQAERDALDRQKPLAVRNKAAENLEVFKANRAFFAKLQKAATQSALASVAGEFEIASNLEGVDKKVLLGDRLSDAFKHAYEVGGKKAAGPLEARIKELESELKKARAAAQGSMGARILSGGKSPEGTIDVSDWFDEKGVLKDEWERAALQGELRG